jgi:hypothetical protein
VVTTVLLIEKALNDLDVHQVTGLHEGEAESFVVLVPAEGDHGRLLATLDDLALGELREAAEEVESPEPSPGEALREAGHALEASIQALRAAGAQATGAITPHDPLDALREAVAAHHADEIIVLTKPHLVEEFFHRDWASRARKLDLPVLRLFAHTDD